jgi:hypothetical protein
LHKVFRYKYYNAHKKSRYTYPAFLKN